MKKILSWFLILILVVLFTGPVTEQLEVVRENHKLEESKPTQDEITQFEGLLNDNTYFYYNNLQDNEKVAYLTMYSSFMSFDEEFTIEINSKKIKNIFTAVLYDNPHIFWVNNDFQYIENVNSITFVPSYRLSSDEAKSITEQMNHIVSGLVDEAERFRTDYEKELYFHDYICENTVYDETLKADHNDTAHSVFLNGVAICEGYSRAMQILLDAADIDNYLVIGDAESDGETAPHMWNIVVLDGVNYHLDVTWDDSGDDDSIMYFYFNLSDSMIGKDHYNIEPENIFCMSDLQYYYIVENSYVEKFYSFNNYVNHTVDVLKSGENSVEFVFENSDDFNKAIKIIENDNVFFDYVNSSVKKSGRNLNPYKVTYYTIATRNYLCIVFE